MRSARQHPRFARGRAHDEVSAPEDVRLLGADERKTRPVLFDFIGNAGTFTPASLLTLPEAQR